MNARLSGSPLAVAESPAGGKGGRRAPPVSPRARLPIRPPSWVLAAIPVALAAAIDHRLWTTVLQGGPPRAWDGTGHFALAVLYARDIFPDTFGWVNAYFGGMPFPNFYPPLFYWCVSLLSVATPLSVASACKLMVALPALATPAAVWILARAVFEGDRAAATFSALSVIPLLSDPRLQITGLSHYSTFLVGLYTQPLGFVLLALWYPAYLRSHCFKGGFALASVLLALAATANFFTAVTAALLAAATAAARLPGVWKRGTLLDRRLRHRLFTPLAAFALSMYWLGPMLAEYQYFVTRPQPVSPAALFPPLMLAWFGAACVGGARWLRKPSPPMWPFLAVCVLLASATIFGALAPAWFPLQGPRFMSVLVFLLALPVGKALAALHERLVRRPRLGGSVWRAAAIETSLLAACLPVLQQPSYEWAFYDSDGSPIDEVLAFARRHNDSRYLVEVPDFRHGAAALDGRALNSYLGLQGNQTASVVFREASPNSLFFNPLITAFSAYPDHFGISSALGDDLDFISQPIARHVERARWLGIRYLVVVTPEIKQRLRNSPDLMTLVLDTTGGWSVFEILEAPPPEIRPLRFRPALVVSGLSVKLRRRGEPDFVRLAEEQFNEAWFDVVLTRSQQADVDRIPDLERFGAVILESYRCRDEDLAVARLREFARNRLLILIASRESSLFRRIEASLDEFPLARVVHRDEDAPGEWIASSGPSHHYDGSAVRRIWRKIRDLLQENKVATEGWSPVRASRESTAIALVPAAPTGRGGLPTLVAASHHPNWISRTGQPVLAATPFFLLTFLDGPTELSFERTPVERLGLLLSAVTLIGLFAMLVPFFGSLRAVQSRPGGVGTPRPSR